MSEVKNHGSIQVMFDRIAWRYDLLNRVISCRLDTLWRNKAIEELMGGGREIFLDLGTGTGDLAFAATKKLKGTGHVVGLDFSLEMLKLACAKRAGLSYSGTTSFVLASALSPPFRDDMFDGVMTAFVLRNITDLGLFFSQAFRVLKPGGKLVSLDMFPPAKSIFSAFYGFYFYRIVPCIGAVLARDREAYSYLSESVRRFDPPETISRLIQDAGFERVNMRRFLSGAVCLHVGEKPLRVVPFS